MSSAIPGQSPWRTTVNSSYLRVYPTGLENPFLSSSSLEEITKCGGSKSVDQRRDLQESTNFRFVVILKRDGFLMIKSLEFFYFFFNRFVTTLKGKKDKRMNFYGISFRRIYLFYFPTRFLEFE